MIAGSKPFQNWGYPIQTPDFRAKSGEPMVLDTDADGTGLTDFGTSIGYYVSARNARLAVLLPRVPPG